MRERLSMQQMEELYWAHMKLMWQIFLPAHMEKAETWLLLHARDAVHKRHKKLCICTVDTDVVVLAITMFSQMNCGQHLAWNHISGTCQFMKLLGHWIQWCAKLCQFSIHFTGCDTVSAFRGRGKQYRYGRYFLMSLKHLKASYSWKTAIANSPCHCWSHLWHYCMIW